MNRDPLSSHEKDAAAEGRYQGVVLKVPTNSRPTPCRDRARQQQRYRPRLIAHRAGNTPRLRAASRQTRRARIVWQLPSPLRRDRRDPQRSPPRPRWATAGPSPTGIPGLRSRSRHRIQTCHHARTGSRRHNRTRSQPFCAISIRPRYAVVTKALPQTSWRGISGHLSNTAIKGSESTSSRCMNDQMSVVVHARIFVQTADQ